MAVRNAMEIFTVLDKSNCRACGEKTCLAFAGAVFTGKRQIDSCPSLSLAEKKRLGMKESTVAEGEDDVQRLLAQERAHLASLDFHEAAERCGGQVKNGRLAVKVLGKDFKVDAVGGVSSDIHMNSWVLGPFLAYVLHGKGLTPKGEWISYREVQGGRERYGLFRKRCEEDMRKIADSYPDLFKDMVEIFQGREVESRFAADISVVLMPLPKVPVMICYWLPEDGIESTLNVFFDSTVDDNLGNDGIYTLCAGFTGMFGRLAERHGIVPETH